MEPVRISNRKEREKTILELTFLENVRSREKNIRNFVAFSMEKVTLSVTKERF